MIFSSSAMLSIGFGVVAEKLTPPEDILISDKVFLISDFSVFTDKDVFRGCHVNSSVTTSIDSTRRDTHFKW